MPNLEQCSLAILSEDTRDFIENGVRTPDFEQLLPDASCQIDAGYGYQCVYFPAERTGPVTLSRFSYSSIPKCYSPVSMASLNQAGILPVQNFPSLKLRGNGILIGFMDSGIDYTLDVFQNPDGTTRILSIWDQTDPSGSSPEGFPYGSEYRKETIDLALRQPDPFLLVPSRDETGHGTYTASLAAGSGIPGESFLGAAPQASLAVVKLKGAKQYLRDYYFIPPDAVCYQETDLILGLKYLNDLADSLSMPLVLCTTVGTNLGGHSAVLPFPSLLDRYSSIPNHIHVTGVGNEADKRHHYFNRITSDGDEKTVEIRVDENTDGFFLELWTKIPDILSISILSPSGENTGRIPFRTGSSTELRFLFEQTTVFLDYRLIVEKTTSELIFFRFQAPAPGIWKILVEPRSLIEGSFHMWLPQSDFLKGELYFLESDPDTTLTNPACTAFPVVVAYYDGATGAVSQSSGRGYTREGDLLPDLAAPGINVTGALPGGRFAARSGSCAACAITGGAIALMLEWLLFDEKIPGIDSAQIKSLLILGALRPELFSYPNREWGYGQLNLYQTFEVMRQL